MPPVPYTDPPDPPDQQDSVETFVGSGYTWDKLRALEDTIATGALLVRVNNRTTQFQSATQLLMIKNDMLKALREIEEQKNPCKYRRRAFKMRLG